MTNRRQTTYHHELAHASVPSPFACRAMTLDRLHELAEHVLNGETTVSECREGGLLVSIALVRREQASGGAATELASAEAGTIVSSMAGSLHLRGEPGAPPFAHVGQAVEAGQRVALLETMKTFCPVVTTRPGRIVEILVEHGAEVAFGQPLFRVA